MIDIYSGVVTRGGQVTIPAEIRRSLDLKPGDRAAFVLEYGSVRLAKAQSLVEQTAGMLSKYALIHVPTDEEMNEAVEIAIADDLSLGRLRVGSRGLW